MTDQERIAKLRYGTWDHTTMCGPNPTGFCSDETPFVQETADRIEQLAATCEELEMGLDRQAVRLRAAFAVVVKRVTQEGDEALAKLTECEARLGKAVEWFKKLDRRGDALETFDPVVHEIVIAALAELEK